MKKFILGICLFAAVASFIAGGAGNLRDTGASNLKAGFSKTEAAIEAATGSIAVSTEAKGI